MTVEDLLKNGFGAIATPETDREITGVYIGDLLSWVMGRGTIGRRVDNHNVQRQYCGGSSPCRHCLHNSGGGRGNTRRRL